MPIDVIIMSETNIRKVNFENDREELVILFVNAFEHQRQYINVTHLDGENHRAALKWIFERRLLLYERFGDNANLLLAVHDGKIVGAGGIALNAAESTLYDLFAVGFLLMPFSLGFGALMRAMSLRGSTENTIVDPFGGKVMLMAVEPNLQGQGIGEKLLRNLIEDWESENSGDLLLLTQLESSTRFYAKFGFELTNQVLKDGYSNYSMRRPKLLDLASSSTGVLKEETAVIPNQDK